MRLSHHAREIHPSPTLKLNEKASKLKEKGEAVIHLGAGEPKNPAPINAILSASAKLIDGKIKYTPTEGISSLRKAIVRYTEENYDKLVSTDNVLVSSGAKQAIYNLFITLVDQQEEVILLAPYWVSYPDMVKMVYGVPVIVKPEGATFQPNIEDIKDIVSSYTKAIVINSPNNPSGFIYSEDFIAEVIDFCETKGIFCIMDDIYHKLVFDGIKPVSAFKYAKKDIENSNVIIVNGISKLYGMTGFRIGWVIASKKIIDVLTNVQAQNQSCPPELLQYAAEGALNGVQNVTEGLRLMLENNKNVMVQEIKSIEGVRLIPPHGTFYCFPDFTAYLDNKFCKNSIELSNFLLEKALVVTVPGKEFGMEGHLRLSYCGTIKEIKEGIARIKWALDPNSPNEIYIGNRKHIRDWF